MSQKLVIWEIGTGMWYSEDRMKITDSYGEIEAQDEKTASSIAHLYVDCFFFTTKSYFLVRDKTDLALKVHGCVVIGFSYCYIAR